MSELNNHSRVEQMCLCVHEGEVTYITESDVSGYSLSDVVLPLPGYSIQLPKHGGK